MVGWVREFEAGNIGCGRKHLRHTAIGVCTSSFEITLFKSHLRQPCGNRKKDLIARILGAAEVTQNTPGIFDRISQNTERHCSQGPPLRRFLVQ